MSIVVEPARVGRLRAKMDAGIGQEKKSAKALILCWPQNTFWQSGFNPVIYSKPPILVVMENHTVLLAPAIRDDLAHEQAWIKDIRLYGHWTGRASFAESWYEGVAKVLAEFGLIDSAIGYEEQTILLKDHQALSKALPGVNLVGMSTEINECRMIKDPDEIASARIAAAIAKAGKDAFLIALALGKSELGATNAAENAMREFHELNYPKVIRSDFGSLEGGKHCGFECWTMSGPRKFLNTAPPTDRIPREGETGSLLIWTVANGMHAEWELTYRMGRVPLLETEAMEDALEIDKKCLELFKPGTVLEDIYSLAINHAKKRGYHYFPARIGHTIGLGNHESASIAPGSKVILARGMLITIEYHVQLLPDIAATQFSITVEITETGYNFVTEFPELDKLDIHAIREELEVNLGA